MAGIADGRSSSIDLSSAPESEAEGTPYAQRPLTSNSHPQSNATNTVIVARTPLATTTTTTSSATAGASRQEVQPVKERKPRKKKDSSAPLPEKKEKQPRKPRVSTGTSTATSRKKPKIEPTETINVSTYTPPATSLQSSKLVEPVAFPLQSPSHSLGQHKVDGVAKFPQNGLLNHESPVRAVESVQYSANVVSKLPVPAPRSSIYDPVRSVTITRPDPAPSYGSQYLHTPPRPVSHASASPSISSIMNPTPSVVPVPTIARPSQIQEAPARATNIIQDIPSIGVDKPMELDPPASTTQELRKSSVVKRPSSEAPTRATSPKPSRAKEQPPPIPPGSGLLSASLFGGETTSETASNAEKGPNIVLHVDLKDPKNQVINFARLAEEKYGFAALYPRQAAQKERLAKVAAAGAALERSASGSKFGGTSAGESGDDDISVDIDRDSDNDGDITMTGINGDKDIANSGTDGPGQKKRRRRKVEDYDQDDPFVDDSEMLWEAQAAASKDGFFVYCGPLVPEGEKPAVERADGTVKRGRGRGRGGGPGSRGGRGGGTAASTAVVTASEGGGGRGGGPGSRGSGITRKPRITKAERLQREQEKQQREKMSVLAAKPTALPA